MADTRIISYFSNVEKRRTYTVEEAKAKLENYCSYQDRCHQEVIGKLKDMNMIPMAIDSIVHHLITENYLNEERFSRSFARGKFRVKKWGRMRITRELKLRGISQFNIRAALSEINTEDYQSTFEELAQKRLSQLTEKNKLKRRKKLADYLLYRGWESSMVYAICNKLIP